MTPGGAPGMVGESPAAGQAGEGGATGADEQRGFGQVSVLSLPGSSAFDGTYAAASFWPPNGGARCSLTQHGDCSLATCSSTPSVALEDSGPIYLVSARAAYHEKLFVVGGSYASHVESGVYLAEGDVLTVAAPGHTAPRFDVCETMPFGIRVTSPVREAGTTSNVIKVARTADWALRWDSGTTGVHTRIQATSGDVAVVCVAESTRGALTIPASVLETLAAGTPLVALSVAELTVSAEDYDFSVLASVGVFDPDHERLDFELE
jgi:hypothetical protein